MLITHFQATPTLLTPYVAPFQRCDAIDVAQHPRPNGRLSGPRPFPPRNHHLLPLTDGTRPAQGCPLAGVSPGQVRQYPLGSVVAAAYNPSRLCFSNGTMFSFVDAKDCPDPYVHSDKVIVFSLCLFQRLVHAPHSWVKKVS